MFLFLCILFIMMYTATSSATFAHLHNSVWRHGVSHVPFSLRPVHRDVRSHICLSPDSVWRRGASHETQSWNHLSFFKSFYWIIFSQLHQSQHYTSPGTLTCYPPRKRHQALASGGFVGFHYLSRIEVRGCSSKGEFWSKLQPVVINSVVFERLMNKNSILFLREFQGFGASLPRTRDRGKQNSLLSNRRIVKIS